MVTSLTDLHLGTVADDLINAVLYVGDCLSLIISDVLSFCFVVCKSGGSMKMVITVYQNVRITSTHARMSQLHTER